MPSLARQGRRIRGNTATDDVIELAYKWWCGKRPLGWTEIHHLSLPSINCVTPAEIFLANAVASWVSCGMPFPE